MCLTQKVQAPQMLITDGERAKGGETTLEFQTLCIIPERGERPPTGGWEELFYTTYKQY